MGFINLDLWHKPFATENEVDGFAIHHLTEADLKEMLSGKIGAVRKLVVLLKGEKVCGVFFVYLL